METWYMACSYGRPVVIEVQVSSSTEHSVTVDGRRRMKRAASTAFYPTPAEAVDFLRKEVAQQRAAIQRETDKANEFARQVSAIADKYKV